jgi:hypothetical protein
LANSDDLRGFLSDYSQEYQCIFDVSEIARGGEAVVYRLVHNKNDEIVAKTPLFSDIQNDKEKLVAAYE